ncbi:hypothetical protein VYU27_009895, partial [Nannochloropsis oceanica]
VLDFLTDERRRCSEAFGASAAPTVLAHLTREIFLPLQGSFQQRLLRLLGPGGATSLKAKGERGGEEEGQEEKEEGGGFPAVVDLFGSTTQFLSALLPITATAIHTDVIVTVLQPFVVFAERYENLEGAALEISIQKKSKRVASLLNQKEGKEGGRGGGKAVSSRMEELLDMCNSAYPVLEALVERSLAFSAGFHARELLRLTEKHLSADLTSTFPPALHLLRTLALSPSSTSSSPSSPLPTSRGHFFDNDHLQAALRLLQALGRNLLALRRREKEMGRLLGSTVWTQLFSDDAADSHLPSPSSVQVAWVRAVLLSSPPASVPSSPPASTSGALELKAFLRVFETQQPMPGDLLKGPSRTSASLSWEALSLLHTLCLSLVRHRLQALTTLDMWGEEGGEKETDALDPGSAAFYSNLPQPYVTQVGEHILSLIQHLEDFAASNALEDVEPLTTSGVMDRLVEPDWRGAAQALGMSEAETSAFLRAIAAPTAATTTSSGCSSSSAVTPKDEEKDDDAAARFTNLWVHAISQATVALLLRAVLAGLPRLSNKGLQQLQTDAQYLLTVFDNLALPPHPILTHLHTVAGWTEEELRGHIEGGRAGRKEGGIAAMQWRVERRMAELRGILVTFHG